MTSFGGTTRSANRAVRSTARSQSVAENPSIFDLFCDTSLIRWERLIGEGELPSKEQLAGILEANASKPLPAWLIELAAKGLRGELKGRAGRAEAERTFGDSILACGI
jgi:hypothetical protein